jgi:amino acid transporter
MSLNKTAINVGASYAWVSREFNRTIGFFAGWALLVASAVFMVSGTIRVTTVATGWLLAVSAVIALFFFWGWDVTVNLNEETRDPGRSAGKAAVWTMAIRFQVAFYYSLAGLACAWCHRRLAMQSLGVFLLLLLLLFLWPLLSAGFLNFIAIYSIPTFDTTTNIVGLGGIVVGIVPLLLNRDRR